MPRRPGSAHRDRGPLDAALAARLFESTMTGLPRPVQFGKPVAGGGVNSGRESGAAPARCFPRGCRRCLVARSPRGYRRSVSVFSGHVDVVVTALSWRRTVVIEQGRWQPRRTDWKPHGDGVRNIRTVRVVEPGLIFDTHTDRGGGSARRSGSHEVMDKHTYFEYEELRWHKYRSFSSQGDSAAGVCWPEYALGPDQRISERREAYRARFSAGGGDGQDEYTAELGEATWRTLAVGLPCRLK